ncbi:kinetochore protein Spc25-like [Argiope bruennichi]|uniref:kinetochore protein Spc25-like n=1 Tax=Argiope bruennichi TaxID=94029 RepID=UPI00249470FF|nr:kinetochore protein Spc25-like [Argiope bruennichi]
MTLKKKLLKIKDIIEYESYMDESKKDELFIVTDKEIWDVKCDLASFIQQTLNQYLSFLQLKKDIESLDEKQKTASLKLKETLKSIEETKRAAATRQKKKALRSKLYDLYKHNLGFEIKPLKGGSYEEQTEMMFSFHHINKSKPEDEYKFILVLKGQIYDVKSCNPPIKGINGLLEELNKTNDLSAFVVQVRRSFCATVTT